MPGNPKGDRRERELVNRLDEAGFAVMRAPASGSSTDRELPDVLAGDGEQFYAIEAKSSAGDPIYLDAEEVEALIFFARNFGANARIGVRFDREDWYFFHPADLYTTPAGNKRVKLETALAEGEDIPGLAGQSTQTRLTDDGTDQQEPTDGLRGVLTAVQQGTLSIDEAIEML